MFQVQIISFSVFFFISFLGKQFDLQCVVHIDEIQAYFWVVLEQLREQLCLKYKPYIGNQLRTVFDEKITMKIGNMIIRITPHLSCS